MWKMTVGYRYSLCRQMSKMEVEPSNSKAMEAGSSGSSSRNNSTLSNASYLAKNNHDRETSK